MKVLLLGVAADTTNCVPTPPVDEDGRFEYVPIPESEGPEGSVESRTYGNTERRHSAGVLADCIERINPRGAVDEWLTGRAMEDWPLHHDPNFEALTYGESASRAAYVDRIRSLGPGDVVAFYTGLRSPTSRTRDRYLIGFFTVDSILDLSRIDHGGETVRLSELPDDEQRRLMERHGENAHAKRFLATGGLKAPGDGVVIVDGTEPGGRLERAVRMSVHRGGGHHYLSEEFRSALWPGVDGSESDEFYLGGRKKAHLLETDAETFYEIVR